MAKIPKQTKAIEFKLKDVPRSERKAVREMIGKTLVKEILEHTRKGKSPVEGESFSRLSKNYADKKKGGNRTPNLRLSRDMTNAIDYKIKGTTVEVGVHAQFEKAKADGHNNFSGLSSLPKRRFIPDDEQEFVESINKKIERIISKREKSTATGTESDRSRKKKDQEASEKPQAKRERDENNIATDTVALQLENLDDFIINTILRLRDE